MRSRLARAYSLLFFLSGATGLIYQLLWVRVLYQSFGSTIQSITTVVAAYMGGLGLGAWAFGRIADRTPRPAVLYGWLEIAIGVFAIVSPLVLAAAHAAYLGLGLGGSVALRFGIAALVLLIPTTLMGATLPVLTRAFTGDDRGSLKASLAWLYGWNTLGAVAGTALAGFFLVEYVGVRASLWITAAVNLAIGVLALRLGRDPVSAEPAVEPRAAEPASVSLRAVALVLLGVTAFASLLHEIAWTRVLVMVVGGSTYAFTLVLLVFLLGIGLGSVLLARPGGRAADTAASAALAQGLTATGAAGLFVFFSVLPTYIIEVFQIAGLGASARLLLLGVAVGAVVLIPAVGMGMTFPLLTDLTARRDRARAADVGAAYALNTLGSIAGAALTGFVLVVTLGTQATLRAGLAIHAVAALALAAWAARGVREGSADHRRLGGRVLAAAALGTLACVVAVAAPGWTARLIDTGPTIYGRHAMDAAERGRFLRRPGLRQMTFREGSNATVSVWEGDNGRSLRINGKVDASDHGDMDTQIMLGLAPAAVRPRAASALVIGFGSGVTSRVLADVPGMNRVRIIEIEPAVLAMDTLFRHVNAGVLGRPGVSVAVDDARSALQLDTGRYDLIVSEPSNPWVAGVATLYTPEFFRIARRRLAEDGVFCQWIQVYQLPLSVVAGIVRNVRAVFPHVEIWSGDATDLMVLGSSQPLAYDSAWVARLIGRQGALAELGREWLGIDDERQYRDRKLLDESGVARLLAGTDVVTHTDDRPRLEFVAARRFLGPSQVTVLDSLLAIARRGPTAAFARMLGARRNDALVLPIVDSLRRAEPRAALWEVRAAIVRLAMSDTAYADSALAHVTGGAPLGDALLVRGAIAGARGLPDAERLLRAALAAGADPAQTHAELASVAARASRWADAAAAARRALTAGRGTLRHPHPGPVLAATLFSIAREAPPAVADSLLVFAVARFPASARYQELRALTALRTGRCDAAADAFLALLSFGIVREDGPAHVRACRGLGGS